MQLSGFARKEYIQHTLHLLISEIMCMRMCTAVSMVLHDQTDMFQARCDIINKCNHVIPVFMKLSCIRKKLAFDNSGKHMYRCEMQHLHLTSLVAWKTS